LPQALTAAEEQMKLENESMAKLTGLADLILSRSNPNRLFSSKPNAAIFFLKVFVKIGTSSARAEYFGLTEIS
jgi:hypothetical protein